MARNKRPGKRFDACPGGNGPYADLFGSEGGTGFFYVTKKNTRTMTEKMSVKKYDPRVRKHVEFKEGKIK